MKHCPIGLDHEPLKDFEQLNLTQSSQKSSGTTFTHSRLKPQFSSGQSRNQRLTMNGFMHGSQGLQTRSNQAEFLGNGAVTDGHNLMLRGLASVESQQGNSFDYNSGLRSSGRSEVAEAPVSFDFLGGHQQLMKSQHQGISQPSLRQQPGYNDMRLLQQQLMYRQLQEIQRQQQLQQIGQGGRQQNQFNQLSGSEKHLTSVQLPAMLSGMPVQNVSNRMWSNELMGGDLKTLSGSQIHVAGNVNLVQRSGPSSVHGFPNGLMFSHDHSQAMQSVGTVPQQLDQSLYGTPVISTRGSLNYSQFPGMPFECTNVVTKAGSNQAEEVDAFNFQNEGLRTKSLFGNASVQNLNGDIPSGSFQQVNHLSRSVQAQEFLDGRGQADLLDNLQQKSEQKEGLPHRVTNLDSTEEKLLFSADDDVGWNSNTSTGGYLHGKPLESTDYFGGFPSNQSGSWSALMQEALGASSSDTGVQEEWVGLSVTKAELPTGNHLAEIGGSGKQQIRCDDNNMQNASSLTSTAFPLFNDVDEGSNYLNAPSFQQSSTKFACGQDGGVQNDASYDSFQLTDIEASKRPSNQGDQQKQFAGSNQAAKMHFDNVSSGVWRGQMHQRSFNTATDMEFNVQNVHDMWAQQQKMPLQNVTSHPSRKPNARNINETVPSSRPNSLKVSDIDDKTHSAQWNDIKGIAHTERDLHPSIKNLNTQKMNQQVVSRCEDDFRKHVANDSSTGLKRDQESSGVGHAFHSSLNIIEKGSCTTYDNKQEHSHQKEGYNEGYMYSHSHASQHTDSGHGASKNSMLAVDEPHSSVSGSQKLSVQSGCKAFEPQKFQNHPMGNVEINIESASSQSHMQHSQGPSRLFGRGLKDQDQGFTGHSQSVGNAVANNIVDMGKRHLTELQKDARGAEGMQSTGAIHKSQFSATSASFNRSTPHYDQNRWVGQPSHNMLELLHKVDLSRDSNVRTQCNFSNQMLSLTTEVDPSDEVGSHLQLNQSSALRGVGLGLAPPAQLQPGSNHASPLQASLQTADESSSRHANFEAGDKDRTPSLPLAHEASQREDLNDITNLSGRAFKEASQSSIQGHTNLAASSLPYARNQILQQQQQHISRLTGMPMVSQSANLSSENQVDANEHVKQAAFLRQLHESHDGAVADQPSQASGSGVSGRAFPSRLASAASDSRLPLASQFYSPKTGLAHPVNSIGSQVKRTGQQLPLVEPRSVSQSSALSGTPQQGGFSTMLQNVWTNVPAQRSLSGIQPQKVIPNMLHPTNQLSRSRVTSPQLQQKMDDESNKGVSALSEAGACLTNSQVTMGEESILEDNSPHKLPPVGVDAAQNASGASQGQKLVLKQLLGGNSVISLPPLVRLYQQEHGRGKHTQDSSHSSQIEHASAQGVPFPNHDTEAYGSNKKPSDIQAHNYSLLQQMHAMKGVDSDLSKKVGNRPRGGDSCKDASHMDWRTGQKYIYPQNAVFGPSVDSEMGAVSQQSSFPSGVKMLSFSSRENEEKSSNTSSQLVARDTSPHKLLASAQHDLQNHIQSITTTANSTSTGGNEPQISPQMAPTWFKQYGTYKNGQILAMYDGLSSSQHSAKAAVQHYLFGKASESRDSNVTAEQKYGATPVGSFWQSTSSIIATAKSSPRGLSLDAIENNTVLIPKKRKSPTSELLPWYKQVTQSPRKLRNTSMAELEWAQAANRLVEKVEDELEMIEDVLTLPRLRRRLIMTTQLMQQLLPSVPSTILRENASTSCSSVTYFVAKSALGDTCSLICCSGNDSHVQLDGENMVSKRLKTLEKTGDHVFSKVVEDFIERLRKLENDLLRLDKRVSILDARMECQDLERCSIINRFAKFHGRAQTNGAESSLISESVSRRTFPQRQAIALAMPRNLPEGVLCLSL